MLACSSAIGRTWTDKAGRTVEAKFVRVLGSDVVLKLRSGKIAKIPIASLSTADQQFLREQIAEEAGGRPSRIWTNKRGMQVLGRIDQIADGQVQIRVDESMVRSPTGEGVIALAFASLSTADRRYVRSYAVEHEIAEPLPPPDESEELPPVREWADKKGNRQMAQFDGMAGDKVLLTAADGTRVAPYADLSQPDQAYLVEHLSEKGLAHTLPNAEERKLAAVDLQHLSPSFALPAIPEPAPPPVVVVDVGQPTTPTSEPPVANPPVATNPIVVPRPPGANHHSTTSRSNQSESSSESFNLDPSTAKVLSLVGGLINLAGVWWIGAIAFQNRNPVFGTLCFLCCGLAAIIYGFFDTEQCGTPLAMIFVGITFKLLAIFMI